MKILFYSLQFILAVILGTVIACSPTKFASTTNSSNVCDESTESCITESGFIDVTQSYKIGSGKVDILFVNDNSASMSKTQLQLATKFSGFIQNLDSKKIDYRIAITTTDLKTVSQNKLIKFSNGKYFLTNSDSNRSNLFAEAIVRNETIQCEDFIVSMFNTYGTSFQNTAYYAANYSKKCASPDTRGIYTSNLIISENSHSFIREDANLNIIVISNDNVRQGASMEQNDRADTFINLMQTQLPNKYWDFNSIIVKDNTCKQVQTLKNAQNQVVMNQVGPAISGGIGSEYAKISNSSAKDIDNNSRPRGKILDICQSDYAQHFTSMYVQISEDSRMFSLKCTPNSEPEVQLTGGGAINYVWKEDKIVFPKGTEGQSVSLKYKCYTGPK